MVDVLNNKENIEEELSTELELSNLKKEIISNVEIHDWDPENPYHYYTADGKKVVITPEDWEKYKDAPFFREVRAAVEAERAACPGPEYEINPNFIRGLRGIYSSSFGDNYQNYKNFGKYLPEGYSFTPEGVIIGPNGTAYVQSGFIQSNRFRYSTDNPLQFTIYQGKPIEKNLTFYPVDIEKKIKPPHPVDKVMNVGEERDKSIREILRQPTYKYKFCHPPYGGLNIPNGQIIDDRVYFSVIGSDGKGHSYGAAEDYGNLEPYANTGLTLDKDGHLPKPSDIYKHLGLDENGYGTKEQMDVLKKRFNKLGYDDSLFEIENVYSSREEAEKNAIIKAG